jgi:hypothetical protein
MAQESHNQPNEFNPNVARNNQEIQVNNRVIKEDDTEQVVIVEQLPSKCKTIAAKSFFNYTCPNDYD